MFNVMFEGGPLTGGTATFHFFPPGIVAGESPEPIDGPNLVFNGHRFVYELEPQEPGDDVVYIYRYRTDSAAYNWVRQAPIQ